MSDTNPALPLTRLNRIAADNGLDAIQIDSPITFKNADDRAALKTELTLSNGVIEIAGQAARLALPESTPAGQIVKDSLGVKMAGTITAIAEDGSFLFDDGLGHASVGKSLTAVNAAGDALWVFYLRVAGVGTAPTKRQFATKCAGSFTCVAESAGNFDAGDGIGVVFATGNIAGDATDWFYMTVAGVGNPPETFGDPTVTLIAVNVLAGATADAVATAVTAALNARAQVTATRVGAKVTWQAVNAGYFGNYCDNSSTPFDFFADGFTSDGRDAVEWEVAPTFVPVAVAAAATATAVAAALAAAIAGSTCPATATAAIVVVSYVADTAGPLNALIANNGTGFEFSAPTAGIAATGAIFLLIDPPALATAAGWLRLGVAGQVLVFATASDPVSLPTGVFIVVTWLTQDANVGGALNMATGVFTAPEAMTVLVCGAAHVDFLGSTTEHLALNLNKNGAAWRRFADMNARKAAGMMIVTLAQGDTLSLSVWQGSGATRTMNNSGLGSFFQITRLC